MTGHFQHILTFRQLIASRHSGISGIYLHTFSWLETSIAQSIGRLVNDAHDLLLASVSSAMTEK
jgi:hypothetical protein